MRLCVLISALPSCRLLFSLYKLQNYQSLFSARSVVRTARPSIIAPNLGGVERVFSELVRGSRSEKNGLAGDSPNYSPHSVPWYYMRTDTKSHCEVIFWL